MAYEFKYQMTQKPVASKDGSGVVIHDIWKVYREEGSSAPWIRTNRHQSISVPHSDLATALAETGVGAAYKALLADNLDTQPEPVSGWSDAATAIYLDENAAAEQVAIDADDFIMGIFPSYPIEF